MYGEYLSSLRNEQSVWSNTDLRNTFHVPKRKRFTSPVPGTSRFSFEKRFPVAGHDERHHGGPPQKRKPHLENLNLKIKCFNCHERGHISPNFPKAKVECTNGKRLGHFANDCRKSYIEVKNHVVEGHFPINQSYFFDCTVNKEHTRAYVDTGCGSVLIRESFAKKAKLDFTPSTLTVSGYGGSSVPVIGGGKVSLKMDLVKISADYLVVPDNIQSILVIIGQSLLNQSEVMMIVSGKNVRIIPKTDDVSKTLDIPVREIPL